MPYRDQFPTCPRCKEALVEISLMTGHSALGCNSCDGLFVTNADLEGIMRALAAYTAAKRDANHDDPPAACPHCGRAMGRVLRGKTRLDQCPGHGVWFDFGELSNLLRGG